MGMYRGKSTLLEGNFVPGVFISDEPGYYTDGKFGIRLETIIRVIEMPLEDTTYGKALYPILTPTFCLPLSRAVTHPSTGWARYCLTSVFGWELVLS